MASPVPGGPSDAGLVHSALDGDVASFSALLDRYRASRYARALAYLGRPEDAADAVQETFLLALTRLGQVRDPEAVGGWLHAVMRSVCAMELRRPARRVAVAELGSDVPAAQDTVEQVVLRHWVWAALEDLPEHRVWARRAGTGPGSADVRTGPRGRDRDTSGRCGQQRRDRRDRVRVGQHA
jgi:hypothetical protein